MYSMLDTQIQPNYEDMLKAGMHFGRKKTVFNPGMGQYVFTVRNGICIIDLLKTKEEIDKTADYLNDALKEKKLILFVGLTKQSVDSMKSLAEDLNMPYVIDRWLGGTMTNFKEISGRVKTLEEMEKQQKSGELDKYTKKEKLMFERELKKMKTNFEGIKKLARIPDIIFVSSLKESALPIREAKITGVKVIAIANTDARPDGVDCIIPANDRSKKSIDLIIDTIKSKLSKPGK
jgi:small subunit ribosomal protein S2